MGVAVGSRVLNFDVLEEIGRGGMATLFRGRTTGPGNFARDVAVKVLHEHLAQDQQLVNMFLDEARITAAVQHPNVIRVEGLGEQDGQHYIVMEFVDGVTLAALLRLMWSEKHHLPVERAVWIAASIAAGLHAAHEARDAEGRALDLIHRDVSPQNVLLQRSGHVKLIDFGVAKTMHRVAATTAGAVKGKLAYMAPEQLTGGIELDRRVDVFALGTLLWESLALRRLFHAKNDVETMLKVRECVVPPIREIRADVPPKLANVLETMLARSLEERFQTTAACRAAMLTACPEALAVEPGDVGAMVQRASPSFDEATVEEVTYVPGSRRRG